MTARSDLSSRPRNIAASVRARLLNLSRERGEDFNYVLIRYVQERLLYRLSRSVYQDQFVLKGATLFTIWLGAPHRPTKDIDLLSRGLADHRTPTEGLRCHCRNRDWA